MDIPDPKQLSLPFMTEDSPKSHIIDDVIKLFADMTRDLVEQFPELGQEKMLGLYPTEEEEHEFNVRVKLQTIMTRLRPSRSLDDES